MLIELTNNVKYGADWLDRRLPDWYKQVRKSELQMETGRHCIAGQLDLDTRSAVYGFDMPPGKEGCGYRHKNHQELKNGFELLRKLWIEQIDERLNQ